MQRDSTRRRPVGAAAVLALILSGCTPNAPIAVRETAATPSLPTTAPPWPAAPSGTSAPPTPSPTTTPPAVGSALAMLHQLEVKGRGPRVGYDRDLFGQTWADVDRNGCDQRNDVLRRDLLDAVTREETGGCVVLNGVLQDPFSGALIYFVRGRGTSERVQIDHIVALSDAWQKGAQRWTPERRVAFANDQLNLLAVDGALNQQKRDGDAATWLPPDRSYRCAYVARQVAVKHKYGAWVTPPERDAIARVLATCPGEPVPRSGSPVESVVGAARPMPAGTGKAAAPTACDPSYPDACIPVHAEVGDLDCGDVAPTGFAVLQPDPHGLDRDGDGTACEG